MMWGKEYPACYFCRSSCFVPESDKSSFSVDFPGNFADAPGFTVRCAFVLVLVLMFVIVPPE
jgi:hypothetical protein